MLALLVTILMISSVHSVLRTWDGVCVQNSTITTEKFSTNSSELTINHNLYDFVQFRGSAIPSMINVKVDTRLPHDKNQYLHCPWSEPMPLTPMMDRTKESFRDVCYTIKVGHHQMENVFKFDSQDPKKMHEMGRLSMETLEEIVDEIKEFNAGNCLRDMSYFLFANYDQMLYTVNQFKFYDPSKGGKYNNQTPENFFMIREKLHGTVKDLITGKYELKKWQDKQIRDVIMFQMARSLNMIHLRGWVHRNIEPKNYYIKETVDHMIEVRLGEFNGLSMHASHTLHEDTDEETYGGPFYIPKDADQHPDDIGNDYYALGMSLSELLTNESVEQEFNEIRIENHDDTIPDLIELNHVEVNEFDKIVDQMELDFDPLLQKVDLSHLEDSIELVEKEKTHEEKMVKEAINSINDSGISMDSNDIGLSLNLIKSTNLKTSFMAIETPVLFDDNFTFDRRDRILTGNYGEKTKKPLFFKTDNDGITSGKNYRPSLKTEDVKIIKEADKLDDNTVHEVDMLLNFDNTLPSIEGFILPDNVIDLELEVVHDKIETVDIFQVDENKKGQNIPMNKVNYDYNGQNEVKVLIEKMISENYFERFVSLSIFGNTAANNADFQKAVQSNSQQQYLCQFEYHVYNNPNKPALQLTTTECLMVFLARALLQSGDSLKSTYFPLLEPNAEKSKTMTSMNGVFEMIIQDRITAQKFKGKEVTMDQYFAQMNNRNILLI